jgi:hypothetical protein
VNSRLNGSNGIAQLQDKRGNLVTSNAEKPALMILSTVYFSRIFTVDNEVANF